MGGAAAAGIGAGARAATGVAILACFYRRGQVAARSEQPEAGDTWVREALAQPPVSILKPVHGADPALREAIRSHTVFEGEYEFLCGVSNPNDSAIPLLREFPSVRVIQTHTQAENAKVGVLADLASAATPDEIQSSPSPPPPTTRHQFTQVLPHLN